MRFLLVPEARRNKISGKDFFYRLTAFWRPSPRHPLPKERGRKTRKTGITRRHERTQRESRKQPQGGQPQGLPLQIRGCRVGRRYRFGDVRFCRGDRPVAHFATQEPAHTKAPGHKGKTATAEEPKSGRQSFRHCIWPVSGPHLAGMSVNVFTDTVRWTSDSDPRCSKRTKTAFMSV